MSGHATHKKDEPATPANKDTGSPATTVTDNATGNAAQVSKSKAPLLRPFNGRAGTDEIKKNATLKGPRPHQPK